MINVIIVDDETTSLQLFLSQIVDKHEINYHFFHDSLEEIRNFVLANSIEAAFLDIKMPTINGIDLAQDLININSNIKIVFITGLNLTMEDLPSKIVNNVIGFMYKPFAGTVLTKYLNKISDKHSRLDVSMFDSFTCFVDGKPVKFSSSKSEELFALLLTYAGKVLTMSDAIYHLWPDKDIDKAKILYRDAVWRLRKTLNDYNFNCVDFQKAHLLLKTNNISCDYWDYIKGLNDNFAGDFLSSYDWSNDYLTRLDDIYYARHPDN